MRPERIAELRRLADEWECGIDPALAIELAHAIPELLDELEADDKHMAYLREMHDRTEELRHKYKLELRDERRDAQVDGFRTRCDSLAAQVVRLRDCLEERIRLRAESVALLHQQLTGNLEVRLSDGLRDRDVANTQQMGQLLADTEAAATTWLEADRREQRRNEARLFVQERTEVCISGCDTGTDGVFTHHPYCGLKSKHRLDEVLEADRQEQRLKGARDLFTRAEARLSLPTKASYYLDALTAELEAMEDEANSNEH